MADQRDYLSRLNRARRKRKMSNLPNPKLLLILLAAAAAIGIAAAVIMNMGSLTAGSGQAGQRTATPAQAQVQEEEDSQEEQEEKERQEAVQRVIDSYNNLGIVQVSGYLNIREEPSMDGAIIGKLFGDGACEILDTQGEWSHISTGGVEGYISNQYLLTGQEAIDKAKDLVKLRATLTTDNVNIRSQPELDPSNLVGQALEGERYVVVDQDTEGWVHVEEGYISSEYVTVDYGLDEGRKLDMKSMAVNQYKNLVISKVNNYLNIRDEPSMDGKIIGKLTSKAGGEILETTDDGWYKIQSGPIIGYISADPQYTATGQEARDLAMQSATLMAVIKTDVLNVRTEPSTDAKIWTQIIKDERYPVVGQLDGWVQIELDSVDEEDGSTLDGAYISTRDNNVEVRYALNEAIKFSPAEEAANQAASRRSQIVNFALQYVGNPYVWGGTSLTNGVDCSGFTMKVMQQFGVSLPHYSGSQAKMGKAVNSSQMRPGDLIFYAGSNGRVNHVALYIGNGQVVHAASSRSGIKISTWNYRTPVAIRNVLGD